MGWELKAFSRHLIKLPREDREMSTCAVHGTTDTAPWLPTLWAQTGSSLCRYVPSLTCPPSAHSSIESIGAHARLPPSSQSPTASSSPRPVHTQEAANSILPLPHPVSPILAGLDKVPVSG